MNVIDLLGKDYTGKTYNKTLHMNGQGLTSLKGCPKIIEGDFDCSHNQLTSLEYGPEIVDGYYDCSHNQLTSLDYVAKSIGLKKSREASGFGFYCNNNQLTSLKGWVMSSIRGDFICRKNNLSSLQYCPEKVGMSFNCSNNVKLTSLKYAPKEAGSFISLGKTNIKLISILIYIYRNNISVEVFSDYNEEFIKKFRHAKTNQKRIQIIFESL